jgi:hypothetical protein
MNVPFHDFVVEAGGLVVDGPSEQRDYLADLHFDGDLLQLIDGREVRLVRAVFGTSTYEAQFQHATISLWNQCNMTSS